MSNPKLYVVRLSDKFRKIYRKSLHLEQDMLEIKEIDKSYDEYIKPSLLYFTTESHDIAKPLKVRRVIPKGQYIMGILGGEIGRGKPYAGLVLEDYRYISKEFEFKLYGTKANLRVPKDWLRNFSVDVYQLVYVGMINPFRLRKLLPILLSARGAESLRNFLRQTLEVNLKELSADDVEKINTLITELQQPDSLETLKNDTYYVVYRRSRVFSATVLRPESQTVLYEDVAAIECSSEDQAYYYAAVLNYLAYKVVMAENRSFAHHQYARPALAIVIAGLSWKDVDSSIKTQVIRISKQLSQKVPNMEFSDQNVALKYMVNYDEFKKLVEILDDTVEKERLEQALSLVSEKKIT